MNKNFSQIIFNKISWADTQELFLSTLKEGADISIQENYLKVLSAENFSLFEKNLFKFIDKDFSIEDRSAARHKLHTICVSLGISSLPVRVLEIDEVVRILNTKNTEEDFFNLVKTFIEDTKDKTYKELLRAVFPYFKNLSHDYENLEWDELFLLNLFLNLGFSKLNQLSDEEQEYLLQNYLFVAIALGIPVRESLQTALYNTMTPVGYALVDRFYLDAVKGNVEKLFFSQENFSGIISKFEANDNNLNDSGLKIFVNEYLNNSNSDGWSPILSECLSIYLHLKEADLTADNRGHELDDDDKFFNEMVRLVAYFGAGEVGFDEIIKYFSLDNNKNKVNLFLGILKDIVKVDDQEQLEKLLQFGQKMYENNLIENNELVIFHESDGKFHWNTELLKVIE